MDFHNFIQLLRAGSIMKKQEEKNQMLPDVGHATLNFYPSGTRPNTSGTRTVRRKTA
jgi:hypothetical protein